MLKHIMYGVGVLFVPVLVGFIVFGVIKFAPIYGKDLSWQQLRDAWNRGSSERANNNQQEGVMTNV